jgi:hypothetical protein
MRTPKADRRFSIVRGSTALGFVVASGPPELLGPTLRDERSGRLYVTELLTGRIVALHLGS